MKELQATTSLELDKRREKKDGRYPLKLMVIYNRKFQRYKTKYSFTEDEFEDILGKNKLRKYKDTRLEIQAVEKKAIEIIAMMPVFSFDTFDKYFQQKGGNKKDIYGDFDEYIKQLKAEEKINTMISYEYSKKSLQEFTGRKELFYYEITSTFLQKYENWMKSNKRSVTTVGIYLRCLRHIFNRATQVLDISKKNYPFGKGKYEIPNPNNVKKALNINQIKQIFDYQPEEGSPEHFYRDIWLLSYFCNGINIKDVCLLRNKDIGKDAITFIRAKTANSKKNGSPIVVPLIPEAEKIIKRWRKSKIDPDDFVFPFITSPNNAVKVVADIAQTTKQVNKYINRVAEKVGMDDRITSYAARHSFATILKRSGVNVTYISEALGHSNIKTTESYLGSFEDEQKREIARNLTNWGK